MFSLTKGYFYFKMVQLKFGIKFEYLGMHFFVITKTLRIFLEIGKTLNHTYTRCKLKKFKC